jgi:hypothetical protein
MFLFVKDAHSRYQYQNELNAQARVLMKIFITLGYLLVPQSDSNTLPEY